MEFVNGIMNVGIYSLLGIILMMLGNYIIDLVVPCDFPVEIKKGNQAVGWLSAGSFVGIGIILRAAIMSPIAETVEETLLDGIVSTIIYYAMGIVFFVIGYFFVKLMNKKYDLNEEIGKGNAAAGIMVFGIFVGLAIVIGGVII